MRFRLSPTRFEGPFSNQGKFVKWPLMGPFCIFIAFVTCKSTIQLWRRSVFCGAIKRQCKKLYLYTLIKAHILRTDLWGAENRLHDEYSCYRR